MKWIFVIAGIICVAVAIVASVELVHQMELGAKIKHTQEIISKTNFFELPHEQQGQVVSVQQQHEQCINRQQYYKALGSDTDLKC